jgi:hypothetical protein
MRSTGGQRAPSRVPGALGCIVIVVGLVLLSPFILLVGCVAADKVVFELTGECVAFPMTSDACRGAYGFVVWNRSSDPIDVAIVRSDRPEFVVLHGVASGLMGYNDYVPVQGKCDPTMHLVARTAAGVVVAERTGICRRETWVVQPAPAPTSPGAGSDRRALPGGSDRRAVAAGSDWLALAGGSDRRALPAA